MRVFYICSHANDVFYVRAETTSEAKEILRLAITKYLFERNLKDMPHNANLPKMLGDNVIVESNIRKDIIENDFSMCEDMTASAYIFATNGQEGWENWDIEMSDAIGNKEVAESIESMIYDESNV